MPSFALVSSATIFLLSFCGIFCDFPSDYLGHHISDEEYNNRTFCWTPVCMKDSDLLLYAADHDSNKTNPCNDIKTFAMGEFFEHRVPNDRYGRLAFELDANLRHFEKQKRMLLKPIAESEPKMFKVMKSYFRRCINSRHVENVAPYEIIDFGRKLGVIRISPDDDRSEFDLKKAMTSIVFRTMLLFFDHLLAFCQNGSEELLCLKHNNYQRYSEIHEFPEVYARLGNLKVDKSYKKKIVNDYVLYLIIKLRVQEKFEGDSESEILTIREMYEKYPSPYLDWLSFINNFLLGDSQKTLDDQVLIEKSKLFKGLHKLFKGLEEKFAANVVATDLLASSSFLYTPYSFGLADALLSGAKRATQRFEQCLSFIRKFMPPALEALTAANFYDQSVQKSATNLVKLAVSDSIDHISQINNNYGIVPRETRELMIKKLASVKLWVMFPDDVFNITQIDKFYDELDFNESESYVELNLKIINHYWKLRTRLKNNWIKIVHRICEDETVHYFTDLNVINVPIVQTLYPFFHPDRPRFFNMATFYTEIISTIIHGLEREFTYDDLTIFLPILTMGDRSYVKWEENGGIDLQLPAFKLTNRQMFWVCFVHMMAQKFTRNPVSHVNDKAENFNVSLGLILKSFSGIREAFGCDELTRMEQEQIAEFKETLKE